MVLPFPRPVGLGTVVIVPGITGSEIRYRWVAGWAGAVWCSPPLLAAGGLPAMRLPVQSEGLAGPLIAASAGGGILSLYYGWLSSVLWATGWNVVTPYADWRYPQVVDATALVDCIRGARDQWPLKVIAHSRGGLILRRALAALDAAGERGAVSRVIGLGVPHTGSLVASAFVSGDSGSTRLTHQLMRILPSTTVQAYAVKTITACTRSWPAVYELQPQPGCPWLDADVAAALYVPDTWRKSATKPVSAYLTAALANWSAVPPVPSWVDWIDVVGTGFSTPTSVPSLDQLAEHGELGYSTEGDGTVPVASASQSPRKRVATPTGHNSLPIDPRVTGAIVQLLLNGTSTDLQLPGEPFSI